MNRFLIAFPIIFLLGTAAAAAKGTIPAAIAVAYWGASFVTACLYAWDKHRARGVRRRMAEQTLHFFELLGGWPGALLAQRILRHKNRKPSYQRVFRLITFLHLLAWVFVIIGMPTHSH